MANEHAVGKCKELLEEVSRLCLILDSCKLNTLQQLSNNKDVIFIGLIVFNKLVFLLNQFINCGYKELSYAVHSTNVIFVK